MVAVRNVLVVFVASAWLATRGSTADFHQMRSANWHQWRGPYASGVSAHGNPPLSWSEERNVQWKVETDGLGNSTPIVWGDKLFLITAIDTGRADPKLAPPDEQPKRPFGIKYPNTFHQYVVLCLDRNSGKELWRRVAAEAVPQEGHHGDNSFATASPTTDGERLYVWFGMAGLYCYDLDGKLLWNRDLGEVQTRLSFGEGSSPVVHDNRLVVVRDNDAQSTIAVLDTHSGNTVWQKDRDEPSGWATPLVVERNGMTQVITNGKTRVRSYNLENGDLLWECGGQVSNVTPSPVATETSVYCMSGYRGSALYAIPLTATGDISDSDAVSWTKSQGTPYVPSPVLYEGRLYFNQSNKAILTSLDASTGEAVIERIRLPGIRGLYASPVAAAGRIYFVGRGGTSLVLEHGHELMVLATNRLDDRFDASPAIVGDQLFLRGKERLYCIKEAR
jgi:outer membrane protein assembly factor BamB